MLDIGELIQEYFNEREKQKYKTYEISKIIIKYIPIKEDIKKYQMRLYSLYKLFDKNIGDTIIIDSNDNLYKNINKDIIQYINEKINDCGYVYQTKQYIDDIYKFVNENSDILDANEYNILPNQSGELKKINDLYIDNEILDELKEIVGDYWNVKELLLDKRITEFKPQKIMDNQKLKDKINDLIEKNKFDIKKTLKLIPKNDKEDKIKQKDIKYIYEKLCCEQGRTIEEYEIDLEPAFWEKTNKCALAKIINCF